MTGSAPAPSRSEMSEQMADDYTDDGVREAFQQGAGILPPFYEGYEYELQKRGDAFDRWLAEHDRQVAERAWEAGARWGAFVFGNDASVDESRVGLVPSDNPYRKEQEESKK